MLGASEMVDATSKRPSLQHTGETTGGKSRSTKDGNEGDEERRQGKVAKSAGTVDESNARCVLRSEVWRDESNALYE